jgi:mRNA-degrading endonuclease RelE of RelBE toxin-antitoxin system
MSHQIKTLKIFTNQIKELDAKSKKIVYDKIQLIKQNPYRFKKLHSKNYSKIFRVRLNLDHKETRLIYTIIEPSIILVCLLDRKKDYKDLEKYLKNIS